MKTLIKTRKLSLIAILAIIQVLTFMAATPAEAAVYDKPMHITYAISGGKSLTQPDSEIIQAFADMNTGPTLLSPLVLNNDPSKFHTFITDLQALFPNTKFGMALGKNTWDLTDSTYWDKAVNRAQQFRVYTDCIRIDHFNSITELSGEDKMVDFLNYLNTLGFTNIIINPWYNPQTITDWPHIDATWIGIQHDTDWLPKEDRMTSINASWPWVSIMNNYENAPGHLALAAMTVSEQIEKFQLVLDHEASFSIPYGIAFPWSKNYDPIVQGTLTWMDDNYYTGGGGSGSTLNFYATDDTFVTAANPTTNKGTLSNLRVRTENGNERYSFVKFDASGITGTVQAATLKVYSTDVGVDVEVREVSDNSWSESTLVWDNMPALGASIDTTACSAGTWCQWDVTSFVTGAGTYSFVLVSSDNNNDDFASKEGGFTPELVVYQSGGGAGLPGQASDPSPSDGARKIKNPVILSWTPGTDAESDDVYFGTSSGSLTFQGNQTETSFDPGSLAGKTNYYWRIDGVNAQGTTTGIEWTFKTK
jgi:hypothetical protein